MGKDVGFWFNSWLTDMEWEFFDLKRKNERKKESCNEKIHVTEDMT